MIFNVKHREFHPKLWREIERDIFWFIDL